jgi:A/G-specific adenine glycosylase
VSKPLARTTDHAAIRAALLDWYAANARDLPWRRARDPYAVWVAEIMLQQTRVETVKPYYARFLERFPTVRALAEAPLDDVLASWSGLGYYRRARLLHVGALHVAEAHGGRVPASVEEIRAIPGVGAYTTGAIASQAFGLEAPLVDGNVARVLARLFRVEDDPKRGKGQARVWALAGELVRGERPGELNNALMELGATICVPGEPRCLLCPVRGACMAKAAGLERSLPVVPEKKARPVIEERAAVLRVDGGVVLAKRAHDGLFGGLWEPPRLPAKPRASFSKALSKLLGVEVALAKKPAREVEHVLTHRTLRVDVYEGTSKQAPTAIADDDAYVDVAVVPIGEIDKRGVSTLARRVIGICARSG